MVKENQKYAGLTDAQVLMIFSQIATTANLIANVCRERAEQYGGHDSEMDFHALDTMVRGIGALADLPTGGHSVGDFGVWMCGPFFRDRSETKGMRAQEGGAA